MKILENKKALIIGVASNRSIAYGIAKSLYKCGAQLAFTYMNDRMKDRVAEIAKEFDSEILLPCDVANDEEINNVFSHIKEVWGGIDTIVHAVAFAPQEQFEGNYLESCTREGFNISHEISSYSLTAITKAAAPIINENGSILTLSYSASERVVPNYNVMGVAKASLEASVRYLAHSLGPKNIRVNAISAGPIKTLAAAGIKHFRKMLSYSEQASPIKSNITIEQVGDTAAFLCSEMAGAITGEVIHVDNGFSIVAMPDSL